MVAWFKHDIPAWMDGTEDLDDGPYRTYHVICQMIYLSEGPITLNEHGIAGRCKQSIRAFRSNLKILMDLGKLTLVDGRLDNSRAKKELQNVCENRINAGKGGKKSGEARNSPHKPLEIKDEIEASLQCDGSLKTRLEETRQEQIPRSLSLVFETDWPQYYRETFWQLFPKRVDKQAAFRKLDLLRKSGKLPWKTLVDGVTRYAESVRGIEPKYIKGAAAWLNAGKWDDEIAVKTKAAFDVRAHII